MRVQTYSKARMSSARGIQCGSSGVLRVFDRDEGVLNVEIDRINCIFFRVILRFVPVTMRQLQTNVFTGVKRYCVTRRR